MKLKKLLSLVIAIVILISAFAAFGLTASAVSGSGTENDPYLISTAEEFELIRDFPDAHFRLTSNIVLNKTYDSTCSFNGTLDGNGYIVVGINGESPFSNYGTIKNLIVELGKNMESGFIDGNQGTIENVGIVDGHATVLWGCGTLANRNSGTIKNCYSMASLTEKSSSYVYAAGFVAYNYGTIDNCYYGGHLASLKQHQKYLGPFVGSNKEASSSYVDDGGKVLKCFYNKDEACWDLGASNFSGGGTGKSTAAMKMQATYSGWDFDTVWAIDYSKNDGYPYLRIDRRFGGGPGTTPTPTPSPTPTTPADGAVVSASSVTVSPGGTAEVKIDLSGCTGFSNLGIQVGYDADALTLTKVTNNPGVDATYTPAQSTAANPYNMSWNSAISNNTFNGTLATLTFQAKDSAAEGEYPITVSYYKGRDGSYTDGVSVNYDVDHNPLGLSYTNGKVKISKHIPGDIDGDGEITEWDGTLLLRYLAGWDISEIDSSALDISGDGAINEWDGTLFRRYLAGWDVEIH